MKKKTSLLIIFVISVIGVLFSGYLSYSELFKKTCPLGTCTNVIGIPACVYGFFMFLVILIIAHLGLRDK